MEITVDTLSYTMDVIEEGRIRMVISLKDQVELGTLYFEKAKRAFQRKPIAMDSWACVDAKIEGLYIHGGENITPKDMVRKCQDLIKEAGLLK
jgi:hemolysin-activating ACP:hemolysin acyltransferase